MKQTPYDIDKDIKSEIANELHAAIEREIPQIDDYTDFAFEYEGDTLHIIAEIRIGGDWLIFGDGYEIPIEQTLINGHGELLEFTATGVNADGDEVALSKKEYKRLERFLRTVVKAFMKYQ